MTIGVLRMLRADMVWTIEMKMEICLPDYVNYNLVIFVINQLHAQILVL